ncbi:MAG: hypothetical protein RSD04_02330, partial [Clostridia bacterium]
GNCVGLDKSGLKKLDNVTAGNIYVDGLSGVTSLILKDRKQLSKEGLVIILISISLETKQIVGMPEVITRGLVFDDDFIEILRNAVETVVEAADYNSEKDRGALKINVKKKVTKVVSTKLKQRPMVLPIVIEL